MYSNWFVLVKKKIRCLYNKNTSTMRWLKYRRWRFWSPECKSTQPVTMAKFTGVPSIFPTTWSSIKQILHATMLDIRVYYYSRNAIFHKAAALWNIASSRVVNLISNTIKVQYLFYYTHYTCIRNHVRALKTETMDSYIIILVMYPLTYPPWPVTEVWLKLHFLESNQTN